MTMVRTDKPFPDVKIPVLTWQRYLMETRLKTVYIICIMTAYYMWNLSLIPHARVKSLKNGHSLVWIFGCMHCGHFQWNGSTAI